MFKKRSHSSLYLALAVIGSIAIGQVAQAEVTPTTKCVTVATKKTRDTAVAQMEKDIAPYQNSAISDPIIKYYKEELDIAWEAMEYPYCGFGSYGNASAIKSYSKTLSRARSKFLTDIKAKKVVAEPTSKTKVEKPAEKIVEKKEVKKEEAKIVKQPVITNTKTPVKLIVRGLYRGQRSEHVRELQRRLVEHFKLTPESDYITGYFGPLTQKYVIKYQLEKKVIASERSPGAGLVGPKTTAAFNGK